jgi:hypothetical protein
MSMHNIRLEAIDNAKKILKSETISPMFFGELAVALPESIRMIKAYSLCMDFHFFQGVELLRDVAGIVLTKGYESIPKQTPHINDETIEPPHA